MNKKLKTEEEPKSKIRDLKPKKDAKGGASLNYGSIGVTYKPQKPDGSL